MLLSLIALMIGAAVGRARGGTWLGVTSTRIRGKGFLILGLASTLVLTLLEPASAMLWLVFGFIGYIGFAVRNLSLTGMIVLLIGILMNLIPVLANGAVPVSELALQSVGQVDAQGLPVIDDPRESSVDATTFSFLGDIVPVPVFDVVVSLGDLVILVALADIVMNLFLRARHREPDDAAVRYADADRTEGDEEPHDEPDEDDVIDLRRHRGHGPAHAAPGGVKLIPPLPRVRLPKHAIEPPADEYDPQPPPPSGEPLLMPPPLHPRPEPEAQVEADEPVIDLGEADEDVQLDLTDRRPIIDLTVSPTDEQMSEFLRRRADADRQLLEARLAPPTPGHRRNRTRGRRRQRNLADSAR